MMSHTIWTASRYVARRSIGKVGVQSAPFTMTYIALAPSP